MQIKKKCDHLKFIPLKCKQYFHIAKKLTNIWRTFIILASNFNEVFNSPFVFSSRFICFDTCPEDNQCWAKNYNDSKTTITQKQ